jgi:hypothetical protein
MQTTYVRQTSADSSELNETGAGDGVGGARDGRGSGRALRPRLGGYKARSSGQSGRALVEALVNSKIYQEYERALT